MASATLWCDRYYEMFVAGECLGDLIDELGTFAPVDRNAAHPTPQRTKYTAECAGLSHEMGER